jgi:hypothetical protein
VSSGAIRRPPPMSESSSGRGGEEARGARSGAGHPDPADLARVAEGEYDAGRDADLVTHIRGCAMCRAAIDHDRRVMAALAVASVPPPDLLERIRARRAAGESPILPVPAADELAPPDAEREVAGRDLTAAGAGDAAAGEPGEVAEREPRGPSPPDEPPA